MVHSFYELPKAFFVKTKSEDDHSNNKINDNVGERESQVKVKNVLTIKNEKGGGDKHKTYEKTPAFHFFAFPFILFSSFPAYGFYAINK